jgi:excisionase family DNA binding protein
MIKTKTKEQIFDNQIAGGGQLLTIDELASFLNISKKTLYGMVHRKNIPFLKASRLLRFDREQIEAWLSRR